MGNYTIFLKFENPRRGRQARNLSENDPKILDLKSSSEQIMFPKLSLGAPEQRSPEFGTLGSKPIVNVIEDMTEREEEATFSKQQVSSPSVEEKEWPCGRCTYLNSLRHRICVICGATRGVQDVQQSKVGSIVCRNCTFHNEQDATVCKVCYRALDKPETFV